MVTQVIGSHDDLRTALTTIVGGANPNITAIVETKPGFWLIVHYA